MSNIRISHPTHKIKTRVHLPGSKSESNRLLILNALAGNQLQLSNLSSARDTQRLKELLIAGDEKVDVLDAGTSMRFLTAYYCAAGKHKIITGSDRMLQRPIGPLVNALSELGFDVRYLGAEGFPPLEVLPVNADKTDSEVFIEGNISSQFITALLLVAPFLPKGLKVNFTTALVSRPYIEMTLEILSYLGVKHKWNGDSVEIEPAKLQGNSYAVGGDWTSASYWYSIAFLADEAEILLEGLRDEWIQGDRAITDWMKRFGVTTEFTSDGAILRKVPVEHPKMMKMNFRDNPDLAQTFAAMFAGGNVYCTFTGIDSLRIKETDRIEALRTELMKLNMHFDYADMYEFYQLKGELKITSTPVETYNDHRMAMAFAPLALKGEITINNPEVVEKSYPGFWNDLEKAGFKISSSQ
jgi:3-phosphoshikimate 1-carboxyvinyltransferase